MDKDTYLRIGIDCFVLREGEAGHGGGGRESFGAPIDGSLWDLIFHDHIE